MLTPTHLVAAQAGFLAACIATGHRPAPPEALTAMAAALAPDLDSPQSYAGRLLPFLSGWLEHHFGHRTLTHSLALQAAIGVLAYASLPFGYALAIVAGWVSHSVADMMTPAGVCWLWPSRVRCVLPGNVRYRMGTMSRGELGFLIAVALLGVLLMPLAQAGKGTTGLIRAAIGDIAKAREDYDARKGAYAFTLDVKGRDNRSFADVSGRYPVIGPFGAAGFVLDTPDGPRSLCRAGACDWHADHAALVQGAPQLTTTRRLQAERTSVGALLAALSPVKPVGEVYLLGTLSAKGIPPDPPTLEVTGDTVALHYTTPEALATWPRRLLTGVDLAVQVRHAPRVAAPEINPLDVDGEGGLNPLLRKWVEASRE